MHININTSEWIVLECLVTTNSVMHQTANLHGCALMLQGRSCASVVMHHDVMLRQLNICNILPQVGRLKKIEDSQLGAQKLE